MNKRFASVFLICLIFFPLLRSSAEVQFYRSNGLGLPLEEVSPTMTDDFSYILERHTEEDGIEELLYRDGELLRRARYHYKGDILYGLHYEGEELLRESIEKEGKLIEERLFHGEKSIVRSYSWDGDLLEYMETLDQDNKHLRHRYIRGENGRLLQVLREDLDDNGEGEPRTVADFSYEKEGRGTTQWHTDMEGCTHFFYNDGDGKIHEKFCDGIRTYLYREKRENETFRISEEFPGEGREIEEVLDHKRRPLLRIEKVDGQVRREEYLYEEKVLRELIVEYGGSVERTVYTYANAPAASADTAGDGKSLRNEEFYRDEVLVKEIFYLKGDRRREVLYREGLRVVELLYEGEELLERNSISENGTER